MGTRVGNLGLLAVILLVVCSCAHLPEEARQAARPSEQTLFIALDGIPYELMKELYDEGYFSDFDSPSKVITTFPTLSASGFGGLMHPVGANRPPGYDDLFFSYDQGEIQGTLLNPYEGKENDFQSHFDLYRSSTFQLVVMYAAPGFAGYRDLKKMRRIIWRHPEKNYYMIYFGGTDGGGHVLGRWRVKHWLIFMEEYLARLMNDYEDDFGRSLKVVFFSDHGFHYERPKGIAKYELAHRARNAGYTLSNTLHADRHIVSVVLGNVSGVPVYVHASHIVPVVQLLTKQKGVDLVAYRVGDGIYVQSGINGQGLAQIDVKGEGQRFRYHAITGDPLWYEGIVEDLQARGRLDADGFARDSDWFESTHNHYYPDALFRIYHAFNGLVENAAPILMSTHEDYEFGSFWTRFGARVRGGLLGTHGGLFQSVSATFVMENDPEVELPAVLRYTDVMRHFLPNGLESYSD